MDPSGQFMLTEQQVTMLQIGTLASAFVGIVGFSGSLIVSSGLLKNAAQYELFRRPTATQITFGAGFAAGYGPFGVGVGGAVDLLNFQNSPTLAWYDSLGASASISNSTGKSVGVTGNVGIGVIFDARDPGDYTGFSWYISGSVGLRDIQKLAQTELDLSKLVQRDKFADVFIKLPGVRGVYFNPTTTSLGGATASVTSGSTSAGISVSFSAAPYETADGRQRLTHGVTVTPFSVGFGPGMNSSISFSLGFAYYWLAETWS
jgi:hypothetical protein